MTQLVVLATLADLRAAVAEYRRAGESVALAPTMGALHAGHLSLVEVARARAKRVIVSIFVNPTQFAPNEDFARYPRTLEQDVSLLGPAGVDAVFHPDAAGMYPQGFATSLQVGGPAKVGLEDKFRPTHFDGVATVVAKLLLQAAPDIAVFGEKDYQQLAVIRRMVADLDIPVSIVSAPTLRESDGLALSSRNAYLDARQRKFAGNLNQAMAWAAERIRGGDTIADAVRDAAASISASGFVIDYLEVRDNVTLMPVEDGRTCGLRLLAAARMGTTRLIDNIDVFALPAKG